MPSISDSTFTGIGGAVSDIFAGIGALDQSALKAKGLTITAQGTLLNAQGTRLNAAGTRIAESGTRISAESTLLTAEGLRQRAAGDVAEAQQYAYAENLASQNARFANASTAVKAAQLERSVTQTIGGARADIAGAGLAEKGSALDVLSSSAQQGALAKQVLVQQGQMTELGYQEQAASFDTMARAGLVAAATENDIATKTEGIVPYQLNIADQQEALAQGQEKIAVGEEGIAGQQVQLAGMTQAAGETQATGDFIGSALKFAGAIFPFL